jgi:lipocalin-like protein
MVGDAAGALPDVQRAITRTRSLTGQVGAGSSHEEAPTDEVRAKLHKSMIAYAGTYTIDGGKVIHHVDISWNGARTGTDQVRFYKLEGDTLTIKTAPNKSPIDGREGVRVIVWEKVK